MLPAALCVASALAGLALGWGWGFVSAIKRRTDEIRRAERALMAQDAGRCYRALLYLLEAQPRKAQLEMLQHATLYAMDPHGETEGRRVS